MRVASVDVHTVHVGGNSRAPISRFLFSLNVGNGD